MKRIAAIWTAMLFFSLGAAETAFISGTLPLHTIPRTTETHPSDTAFDAGLHRKWKTEDGITVISLLAGEKELYIRADMRLGRKAEAVTKTPDTRFSAKEDAIVFYFDPNLMNRSHRFIGVNCANVVNDGVNNSFHRNYGVRTETKVADNAWRLYLAVSYAELGIRPEQGMVFGLNARQKHAFLSGSLNKPAEWLALSARYPQAELRIHSADGFLHIASDTLKQGVILYDSVNGIQTLVFPFQNGTGKVKPGGRNPPGRIPLIFLGSDGRGRRFLNRLYAEYYVDVYKGQPAGIRVMDGPRTMVWTTPSMRKIRPDEPLPSRKGKHLEIELARNEYEGLPVHIFPDEAREFTVSFSALKTESGMEFPRNGIDLFHLATVHISRTSDVTGHSGEWQDPLIPLENGKLNCPEKRNTTLYLRVHADKALRGGVYEGNLQLNAGGERIAVPLRIRVYDFALADRNHTHTAYGCFKRFPAYLGLTSREQRKEYLLAVCREMARYRISGSNVLSFLNLRDPHGNPDFSELDERIRYLTEELHFTGLNLASLINWDLPPELRFRYHQKYTAEETKVRKAFFAELLNHLREKNTLRYFYWYELDEPNPATYSAVAKYMDTVAELFPGVPRLIALNTQAGDELKGKAEIWSPLLDIWNNFTPWWRERRKEGGKIWWYVCNFPRYPYPTNFIDAPAVMPRIRAWIAEKFGIEGELYWAVDYLTQKGSDYESPYENPYIGNFSNGEGMLFYPPSFKPAEKPLFKPPWPSLRLEMIRDGIEDREYFHEAKECLRRLRTLPAHSGAALAEELKQAVTIPDSLVKSPIVYTVSPEQLLARRRKLAELIVRAQHEWNNSSRQRNRK